MKNLKQNLMIAATLVLVGACNNNKSVSTNSADVPLSELSYSNVATQVIEARCIKCHSAAAGNDGDINLETYANVKANIDLVVEEVEGGDMPPSGALPSDLIALMKAWKDHGAPETAPSN